MRGIHNLDSCTAEDAEREDWTRVSALDVSSKLFGTRSWRCNWEIHTWIVLIFYEHFPCVSQLFAFGGSYSRMNHTCIFSLPYGTGYECPGHALCTSGKDTVDIWIAWSFPVCVLPLSGHLGNSNELPCSHSFSLGKGKVFYVPNLSHASFDESWGSFWFLPQRDNQGESTWRVLCHCVLEVCVS